PDADRGRHPARLPAERARSRARAARAARACPLFRDRAESGRFKRRSGAHRRRRAARRARTRRRRAARLGARALPSVNRGYRSDGPRIAVATRPGFQRSELEAVLEQLERPERVLFFEIEPNPAASRDVRGRIAAGEPLDGLVPDAVARLVSERGLYRP